MHYTLLDSYGFSCHQHAEDALLASGYRAQRTTHRSCYGDGASGSGEMVLRAVYGRERERERYHRVPQDPAVVQQTVAVEKGEGSTRAGPLSLLRAFSSRCPGAAARSEQVTRAALLSLRLVPVRRSSAKRRLSQRMRPRTYSSAQLLNVTQHGLAHRLCA